MSRKTKVTLSVGDDEFTIFVATDQPEMALIYVESMINRYARGLKGQLTAEVEKEVSQ